MAEQSNNLPVVQFRNAIDSFRDNLVHNFDEFSINISRNADECKRNVQNIVSTVHQFASKQFMSPVGRQIQGHWVPVMASMTMHSTTPVKPQPVYDLAMGREEVKARLAPIPVYTVANPKNEFVLVSGENGKQLGFFFFNREDAEALVAKIKEENPRLARDSKILKVTMDNVYEVFMTPRAETGLQGINFRFMPDMSQVSAAVQLYKDAGVPTRQFVGVPVFQAEGLSVTSNNQQFVPLFFHKLDLDVAVQSAYTQRNSAQIKLYREKAERYQDDFNQLLTQVEAASDSKEKANLQARAEKAREKMESAQEKSDSVAQAPIPKVEVGSFEEVMMRMTAADKDELAAWSQVMFVAPGLLQQPTLQDAEDILKSK